MQKQIDQFLTYLSFQRNYATNTVVSYRNDLEDFAQFLSESYDVNDFQLASAMMIRSWVVSLKQEELSSSSINRKLATLRSFFKFLKRKELIAKNPMLKVINLKTPKRLPNYVQEAKMVKILEPDLEEDSFESIRDQFVIETFYTLGIRRAELMGLKLEDIDVSRKELRVLGKGNKVRVCPTPPKFLAQLEKYLIARREIDLIDQEYLFVTSRGKKLYPKAVYNIVNRRLKQHNAAKKNSPHVLRHSFATHLSNNGAELNAIKELLGHASLAATQVYTHNSIEKLKKAYQNSHPRG